MTIEVLSQEGTTPTLGRFLLFETLSLMDLQHLPPVSPHFALFTAFDASDTLTTDMLTLARSLLDHGLAYACCWGEDCERFHDAIDEERFVPDDEDEELHDVVMTTWHDGEPLEEALGFFGVLALPTPLYARNCRDYVIACSPNYSDIIRSAFTFKAERHS